MNEIKLHLACGYEYHPGYINIDLYAPEDARVDLRHDVRKLPYEDNSADEIKAFHVIEHFHFWEAKDALKEWYRVLKPGGRIWLETPDFLAQCKEFVAREPNLAAQFELYGNFFAYHWIDGQGHKFLFTEQQLYYFLIEAGFKNFKRLPATSKYAQPPFQYLFLNVEAYK